MSKGDMNQVFELANHQTPFIEFELRDGTSESLPYINLRQIHLEPGGKRVGSDRLILYFDQGLVEIIGDNLTKLKTFIKLNILETLRIGILEDLNDPAVKSIIFKASKKFDNSILEE